MPSLSPALVGDGRVLAVAVVARALLLVERPAAMGLLRVRSG
jgi:hypothetical protein